MGRLNFDGTRGCINGGKQHEDSDEQREERRHQS